MRVTKIDRKNGVITIGEDKVAEQKLAGGSIGDIQLADPMLRVEDFTAGPRWVSEDGSTWVPDISAFRNESNPFPISVVLGGTEQQITREAAIALRDQLTEVLNPAIEPWTDGQRERYMSSCEAVLDRIDRRRGNGGALDSVDETWTVHAGGPECFDDDDFDGCPRVSNY